MSYRNTLSPLDCSSVAGAPGSRTGGHAICRYAIEEGLGHGIMALRTYPHITDIPVKVEVTAAYVLGHRRLNASGVFGSPQRSLYIPHGHYTTRGLTFKRVLRCQTRLRQS